MRSRFPLLLYIYIYIYARHILVPWTRLVVVHEAGNMDRARRQPEMRANTVGCNARDRVAVLSRRFPAPVVHGLVSRARVVVSVGQVCTCVYTTHVHAGTYIEQPVRIVYLLDHGRATYFSPTFVEGRIFAILASRSRMYVRYIRGE